jgi:hypothetical protein
MRVRLWLNFIFPISPPSRDLTCFCRHPSYIPLTSTPRHTEAASHFNPPASEFGRAREPTRASSEPVSLHHTSSLQYLPTKVERFSLGRLVCV